MKSIKGPRSALTDFIESEGIKITNKRTKITSVIEIELKRNKKTTPKRIKTEKPTEFLNHKSKEEIELDEKMQNVISEFDIKDLSDETLNEVSEYLSRNRLMNQDWFNKLKDRATNLLSVFDCSMIKSNQFINFNQLRILTLHQCGQITESCINKVLINMKDLKELNLTGGYLLENIDIPKSLTKINLSDCNRLMDIFIDQLNKKFTHLEELRLSRCYRLTPNAHLMVKVDKLFVCGTLISENFIKNTLIEELSVNMCPNIQSVPIFKKIRYLDINGIVTISDLKLPKTIEHLSISRCSDIRYYFYPNLISLDISHFNVDISDEIFKCKNLKILNVSWNQNFDDSAFKKIIQNLDLSKLYVFGCFSLTIESCRALISSKSACKVIGNPSETIFQMDENKIS